MDQERDERTNSAQQEPRWHAMDGESVLQELQADEAGLNSREAKSRQSRYGHNALESTGRDPIWIRFLRHFHNVLIYILLLAALGTALLGHWVDTGVILAVVLINTLIGFVQEGRAEKAMDSIRQMLSPRATVLRDGQRQQIEASELVPGDLLFIQSGDKVAADTRLLETKNLQIEEAVLTGESAPVEKARAAVTEDAALGDRSCMAYSGTLATFGRGMGVVVATGKQTQVGRISTLLQEVESLKTPLVRQVEQFGRWLAVVIIAISLMTFGFGYWVRSYPLGEMFLAAASLAVSTIPEGLPAIMTIALAIGVQKMARRNAIIRRLPAVETLGSVSTICSDKTGTLTRNEMTVQLLAFAQRDIEVGGVGYEPRGEICEDGNRIEVGDDRELLEALRVGLLCNESSLYLEGNEWRIEGDPTEVALLTLAGKAGLSMKAEGEQFPRRDVIPFDSEHKYMATLHQERRGQSVIYLKGAPEKVLSVCRWQTEGGKQVPLDRALWKQRMEEVAARGHRLLAIARKEAETQQHSLEFSDIEVGGFSLLAVAGIMDPPREEAIEAVRQCHEAGIRVKMITGDHLVTAKAIGERLGITRQGKGRALAGQDLDELDDAAMQHAAGESDIFARTSPEHKLRLVAALQQGGGIVAMTGDGVNDAPALKRADVGVAMGGKGTEAAKEASEMVLADDNFASISHAVEEGRTVYDNIRKAILHMLPTNAGQSLTIMMAVLMGFALPLTPVQVLWVNMVTSVTLAMALAFEPSEPDVMKRPPRAPDTPLLSGFLLWRIPFVALLLWAGTFGQFVWMQEGLGVSEELARTVAINTLVAGQAFYLLNLRRIFDSVLVRWAVFGSRSMWIAIGILVLLQMAFTYTDVMNELFGTTGLPIEYWWPILSFGVLVFMLVEIEKMVVKRVFDTGKPIGSRTAGA